MDQDLPHLKTGKARGTSPGEKSRLGKLKAVLDGLMGRGRCLELVGHRSKCQCSSSNEIGAWG